MAAPLPWWATQDADGVVSCTYCYSDSVDGSLLLDWQWMAPEDAIAKFERGHADDCELIVSRDWYAN